MSHREPIMPANRPAEPAPTPRRHCTMRELANAFYGSAEWRGLRPTTQVTYRGILERYCARCGQLPAELLKPHHLRRQLDEMGHKPAAANNLLKVLRMVMRYAVDRGIRPDCPTEGVRRLRYESEGFPTWSDDDIARFQKHWPLGTRQRLAFDLLLYTAQRSGDVRMLGPANLEGHTIVLTQSKTGEFLEIPLHPDLRASLKACPTSGETWVQTAHGAPFTAKGFGNWMSEAALKAGLRKGISTHGIRKGMARRLAEAGCSAHQIKAMTGHRTLREVERYTRAVNQRELAKAALRQLANPTHGQNSLSIGAQI